MRGGADRGDGGRGGGGEREGGEEEGGDASTLRMARGCGSGRGSSREGEAEEGGEEEEEKGEEGERASGRAERGGKGGMKGREGGQQTAVGQRRPKAMRHCTHRQSSRKRRRAEQAQQPSPSPSPSPHLSSAAPPPPFSCCRYPSALHRMRGSCGSGRGDGERPRLCSAAIYGEPPQHPTPPLLHHTAPHHSTRTPLSAHARSCHYRCRAGQRSAVDAARSRRDDSCRLSAARSLHSPSSRCTSSTEEGGERGGTEGRTEQRTEDGGQRTDGATVRGPSADSRP